MLFQHKRPWARSAARGCRLPVGGAVSPITTSTVPTGTTSPSATRIRATLPGRGRRDLDRRLVGLDLDERVVLCDLLSLDDEPARDLALGQALAEVGQLELVRHGCAGY